MDTRVFSPIIASSQSAMLLAGADYITIPFSIPSIVDFSQIKHMQVSMVQQNNNQNMIEKTNDISTVGYDNIYYTRNFGKGVIKLPLSVCKQLTVGLIYKLQIRFGYADLWATNQEFSSWKNNCINNGDFSEWSTVMAIKLLDRPSLTFVNEESFGVSNNPTFKGCATFPATSQEGISKYKFILKNNDDEMIESSDWLAHKTGEIYDSHQFTNILTFGATYIIEYRIQSTNGYETSINYTFIPNRNVFLTLPETIEIAAVAHHDRGVNTVSLTGLEFTHSYAILRADEITGYQVWDDVFIITATDEQYEYCDYAIENGIAYKYGIQELYADEVRSDIKECDSYIVNYFEYSYLIGEGLQLPLRFNNTMNSFKRTTLISKQDTIGSRYPLIMRNGQAYYAEFPITGLISFSMDEYQDFCEQLINLDNEELTSEIEVVYEKQFRDKVIEFLNNGEQKLFKSPTEGNIIVALSNISFTPNQTLGRRLYSFSATAYEVADYNLDNIHKLNIIPAQQDNIDLGKTQEFGGSLMLSNDNLIEPLNILDAIQKQINQYNTGSYGIQLTKINRLRIEVGELYDKLGLVCSSPATLIVDGVEIKIPIQRQYTYPLELSTDSNIYIYGDSSTTIDYIYTVEVIPNRIVDKHSYGTTSYWGQIAIKTDITPNNRNITTVIPYSEIISNILGVAVTFDKEQQCWVNEELGVRYKVNHFKQLLLDTVDKQSAFNINIDGLTAYYEGRWIIAKGQDLEFNETCILNLPEKQGDYIVHVRQNHDSEGEYLLLINYYVIIDWIKGE